MPSPEGSWIEGVGISPADRADLEDADKMSKLSRARLVAGSQIEQDRRTAMDQVASVLVPKVTGSTPENIKSSLIKYFPGTVQTINTPQMLQFFTQIAESFPGGDLAELDHFLDRKSNQPQEPGESNKNFEE